MKKLFVIFASVALIAAFAVTASAADWSMYGSARMATFMVNDDFGDKTFQNNIGDTDDDDLQWDLQGNSRIGANVKGENIKAQFEWGVTGRPGDNVGTRRLYGVYDFGGWTLKIGQDYTPTSQFISGQAFDGDIGLLGMGTFYGFRRPQIAFGFGSFEVALLRTVSDDLTGGVGDVDEGLPGIEAKWGMKSDTWNFTLMAGYNTYDIDMPAGSVKSSYGVDSTVFGAMGGMNFGQFWINASVAQGTNIGIPWFGYSERDVAPGFYDYGPGDPVIDTVNGNLVDMDTMMYALIVGMKFSDTMKLEAGIGFKEDEFSKSTVEGNPVQPDDMMSYYVQLVWQVAPGVHIIPEVGSFDYGDTIAKVPSGSPGGGSDSGDTTYFGAKWQIDF